MVGEASNGEQGIDFGGITRSPSDPLDLNAGNEWSQTLDKLREKALSGRIVVSAASHEEDVVTALKRGADGYLLKDLWSRRT